MKTIASTLLFAVFTGAVVMGDFQASSVSAVSFIGGVIKARHDVPEDAKYPRKDCPVCKGTGSYISGDGIEEVDCGYCVPDKAQPEPTAPEDPPLVPIQSFYLRK